jgi:glutamate synthase domain-containing protein 1
MGSLILVGNPLSLVPLVNSLTSNNRNTEKMSVEYLTEMLTQVTNADMPTVSGYMLTACGFHLFQSTAFAGGAAGTEGVFTTTFGDGAKTTRACIAMGFYAVANATGMEPEMRRANEDNFQMVDDWIWTADRIVGDLDVDPAIDSEQQLRVVEVRVTDAPF